MFGVIPQLTRTMGTLVTSIADFIPHMQSWIREFFHNNQEIIKLTDQLQFNPGSGESEWAISLLGNGAGNMMNTTMSAVGSLISGLATFFIAVSLCLLYSFSERKAACTGQKSIFRFSSKTKSRGFPSKSVLSRIGHLRTFLTGQCLEAVILGCMFCRYTEYFADAICTLDRRFNCVYGIGSLFSGHSSAVQWEVF